MFPNIRIQALKDLILKERRRGKNPTTLGAWYTWKRCVLIWPKTLADSGNPVILPISGLSAGQVHVYRQHLKQKWFMAQLKLREARSLVRADCCKAPFVQWHIQTLAETRKAKHTATKGSPVHLLSMTERIFKESHRGRTIKYFMTIGHHLKSFLWFHMNHQNIPGILHQCTNSTSQLSLYSTLKMSLRNPWPSLGFGKRGHCPQLHLEVRRSCPIGSWATLAASQSHFSVSDPRRPPLGQVPCLGSPACAFLWQHQSHPQFYQQMKAFPFAIPNSFF